MEEGVTKATYLNSIISDLSDKIDVKSISDGRYTFEELYDYIAYLEALYLTQAAVYKVTKRTLNPDTFIVVKSSDFLPGEVISLGKLYPIKYKELFADVPEDKELSVVNIPLTDFYI